MTDGAQAPDHPHGSIGEEAIKLAEAVQGWLGQRTGHGAAADTWAAATAPEAFDAPECKVCPICRAMHFVSTMQPDVFTHLADAATSLAAAARAMGDQDVRARRTPGAEQSGGSSGPEAGTP